MKISNLAVATNINHLYQRKNNIQKSISKDDINQSIKIENSEFLQKNKPQSLNEQSILSSNEAIGVMQIANDGIKQMSKAANELEALSKKYEVNPSNELEYEFNSIAEQISQIADGLLYNEKPVFGANYKFQGSFGEMSLSLQSIENTAELEIEDFEAIKELQNQLYKISQNVDEAIAFSATSINNTLANSANLNSYTKELKEEDIGKNTKLNLNAQNISDVHDKIRLKEQLNHLLD